MTDIKKDHSIGEGTGAVAGALTGAAVGSVAGPLGTLAGAAIGGIAGAAGGGAIAEAVNPTDYSKHFETNYKTADYYDNKSTWNDYQPAYQYGYETYGQYRGQRFQDVEPQLERDWNNAKNKSSLAWGEAKGAVRDGWHYIERAMPGDADHDGR
ncbi:MAG: glycine zipper domain-containing protein [Luteimonas sp.]